MFPRCDITFNSINCLEKSTARVCERSYGVLSVKTVVDEYEMRQVSVNKALVKPSHTSYSCKNRAIGCEWLNRTSPLRPKCAQTPGQTSAHLTLHSSATLKALPSPHVSGLRAANVSIPREDVLRCIGVGRVIITPCWA